MTRLRGIPLYAAIVAPFLVLPSLLIAVGTPFDVSLSVTLLAAIATGIVATFQVRQMYHESAEPRSIFWAMLVSALEVKVAFGAWIAYLVVATLAARAGIELWLPPQPIRQLITSIAAIVLLVTPVYYRITIALERAEAAVSPAEDAA